MPSTMKWIAKDSKRFCRSNGTCHRPHTSSTNVRRIQWNHNIHKTSWNHCLHLNYARESVCCSELTDDTHLAVYAVSTQPATESPTQVTIGAQSSSNNLTAEEPYAGFNAQIQQILSEADALHNEVDRQGLKEVLQKYKDSFAKDSLDCGLTNIHTVRIPTNPNAPPTFVRQYKFPIASYEPVQEIVDSLTHAGKRGHLAL